jgi:hypothetical protein
VEGSEGQRRCPSLLVPTARLFMRLWGAAGPAPRPGEATTLQARPRCPVEIRCRRSGGRRGAGARDSGDREDDEEPDRVPQNETGTLESVLTGITAETQLNRICRRRGLFRPRWVSPPVMRSNRSQYYWTNYRRRFRIQATRPAGSANRSLDAAGAGREPGTVARQDSYQYRELPPAFPANGQPRACHLGRAGGL